MLSIKFETSERSDNINWVKNKILGSNLDLMAFEGYTVKNNNVSLLLDRGMFENDCKDITSSDLRESLLKEPMFNLESKIEFSEKLNCPYYFYTYSYNFADSFLFKITRNEVDRYKVFKDFNSFANWTNNYRDLVMKSNYEESGLPKIDILLRKLGIPWPGNLDYVLLKNNKPTALIEFQRTAKLSVKDHCNNTWFLPTQNRKGDLNRWLAIDIIRKQSNLPLFVIVWSDREQEIKLKLVKEIVYPNDTNPKKGLHYKHKEIVDINRMINILNRY